MRATTLLSLTLAASPLASAAVSQITRTGKYLYDASGQRFFIKGVAFQKPGTVSAATEQNSANGGFPEPTDFIDSLADTTACNAAIADFKTLAINTVRVYSMSPANDHSACMNALNDANIHVIADISLPLNGSINRASPSWDVSLLSEYIAQIDNLRSYPNLLAFNVGNEILTGVANSVAAPFIKAAARDVKAYLKSVSSKALVSYASTDGDSFPVGLADYLTCGSEATSIDLFGLNNYRWCGASSLAASGYNTINDLYNNLTVAAYFSEFGCNTSPPRLWTEVPALLSAPMSDVWSGGLAFGYYADPQGFGLTANGTNAPNADFTRLATVYANATGPNTPAQSSATASSYGTCPAPNANFLASNTLPPTPNAGACTCTDNNAFACKVRADAPPAIQGELLDYTCQQLGAAGLSCNEIGASGGNGTYGSMSGCSPATKLNWAVTQFYLSQNSNAQACDFGGNATVATGKPSAVAAVESAVQSCFSAGGGSSATFIPSATGSASGSSGSGRSGANSGASMSFAPMVAVAGCGAMAVLGSLLM